MLWSFGGRALFETGHECGRGEGDVGVVSVGVVSGFGLGDLVGRVVVGGEHEQVVEPARKVAL